MWFSSWLRIRTVSRTRRPACRFQPRLEALEDRAVPATFLVNTTADVLGHDNGMLSLRQATLDAKAACTTANTIVVPAGTYNLTQPVTPAYLGGSLDINQSSKGLTINGAGAGTTIIDGLGLDRVFDITPGTVSISGLTIQGGNAGTTSYGGGIRNQGAALTVSNCIFSGNTTGGTGGGAIANFGGILTVNHCTFAGNSSIRFNYGGGAIWINSGTVAISDSTFVGNSAGMGGAIFNTQGTVSVSNCTFSGNFAIGSTSSGGGAIDNQGTMTVSNCTLSGNSATGRNGGGIFNLGKLTVRGSTVSGNFASVGADLYGKASISDSTIGDVYYR